LANEGGFEDPVNVVFKCGALDEIGKSLRCAKMRGAAPHLFEASRHDVLTYVSYYPLSFFFLYSSKNFHSQITILSLSSTSHPFLSFNSERKSSISRGCRLSKVATSERLQANMKEVIVHPTPTLHTTIHDVPVPSPGPNELIVKVIVAGTNPKGLLSFSPLPPFPFPTRF
jgi:hypothetical protein